MSIHPSIKLEKVRKQIHLSDYELEFLESDSSLNVKLRAFPLFLLNLRHSFLK
jgi:hypothetical protein